ncbi:high-affinity choline transporter 1 [Nilaparvata lugens]|uniref:high-affinity choline transporter 1 n=1 Tax=Nilaparvata lugens TaxID=108931 RepID=UPI00193E7D61|nr:high-affinity choline transporter 1 [Nilaparvata lugens]XP_022206267.2 high-affinity choline transporter 1 [Nilaparvata lugens]
MAVFLSGLVGIVVFYVLVLAVGIWAGTKQKNNGEEEVLLAGRSLGFSVGVLTLIATWVGGGYINGTAEAFFRDGLLWCQVPIGYSLSLIFGSFLFVKPMREANYVTMLDPFQQKYGQRVGGLLFFPALFGDVFWIASILASLGSSLRVILDINSTVSIIISTIFAAAYTVVGGLYSVTYTDVLQIFCIIIGLILCTPFAYYQEPFTKGSSEVEHWLGHVQHKDFGIWIDGLLLLIFGGIPWQGYFQRVLSIKSTYIAQTMGIAAMFGCIAMAVPAAAVGLIAKSVDWTNVPDFNRNITVDDASIIMPLVFKYMTPTWVSFFGLGAVSAAVMSSADSSILASSAMFSRNIYKLTFRPKASEEEVLCVLRIAIVVIALMAAVIALNVDSIYYLSYLCSDLVYVVLFPQLLLVVHWPGGVTTYGCLAAYIVGLALRILGGEQGVGIPAIIHYPWFDEEKQIQRFPFRTLAMLSAMLAHVVVSCLARWLFQAGILYADRWDVLYDFPECHFQRIDHSREPRAKEGATKCRSNKAVRDAMVGKRMSQSSADGDGSLINHDDQQSAVSVKRDRSSITYQTSTTSDEPSICIS